MKINIIVIITGLVAVIACLFLPQALYSNQNLKSSVTFLSPQEDDLWTGDKQITIDIQNIDPEDIVTVELYLDGRLIKEFITPPYDLNYHFGKQGQNHTLKAVIRGKGFVPLISGEIKSFQVDQAVNVEVQQVVLPVTIKDKKGNYIRGLQQKDFILSSEDIPLEISYLSTSGTEKFTMAQVIDISYSMRDKIHDVFQASREFTSQLLSGKDKGTFVFFNQRVYNHLGFTSDTNELIERLKIRAPVMGGTALYDAIAYTLNLMNKTQGWNIMVVFSDGYDNSSYINHFSLLDKVKESPVMIYGIDNQDKEINKVLARVCSLSGGMMFPLLDVKKTNLIYNKIREEIKAQYIIYFNPKSIGNQLPRNQFHPLTVKIKGHDDYEVRSLKGFFY